MSRPSHLEQMAQRAKGTTPMEEIQERLADVREQRKRIRNPAHRIKQSMTLDRLSAQAMTILARELLYLMEASHGCALEKEQSNALVSYLKLIKSLQKEENENAENLSEEELKAIADKAQKGESDGK